MTITRTSGETAHGIDGWLCHGQCGHVFRREVDMCYRLRNVAKISDVSDNYHSNATYSDAYYEYWCAGCVADYPEEVIACGADVAAIMRTLPLLRKVREDR